MVTDKIKGLNSPGADQIPAELIRAGVGKIQSEFNKLVNSMDHKTS
jgi:hypothetical protein